MTQPAAEQLLNLANRAERHGGLTPDEAQRLRDGLTHHCARAERAEAAIEHVRKLTDEADTWDGPFTTHHVRAALDEHQEQPCSDPDHVGYSTCGRHIHGPAAG